MSDAEVEPRARQPDDTSAAWDDLEPQSTRWVVFAVTSFALLMASIDQTIVASARLLFKPRPWQLLLHCIFAVYLGQIMIHNVIDNDHWRHLFMIYGLLWGLVAAEKAYAPRTHAPASGAGQPRRADADAPLGAI